MILYLITLCSLFTFFFNCKAVILTDPIISVIDGNAMGAEKIREIKWTIQQIQFIQYGDIKDIATQKREGRYPIHGQKCSLKKLCKLENLKDEKPNLYATIEKEITEILDTVKKDLGKATDDYLISNYGSKHLIRKFITEWSIKAKLPQTILIKWAHLPEGKDTSDFRDTLFSLNQVDQYCNDLTQFLEDFINSFPIAMEKYHAKYPGG